mgnify:CR=1 FL=1
MMAYGIFPDQELNPRLLCLLHWYADSWPLSHQGSPIFFFIFFSLQIFYCKPVFILNGKKCYMKIKHANSYANDAIILEDIWWFLRNVNIYYIYVPTVSLLEFGNSYPRKMTKCFHRPCICMLFIEVLLKYKLQNFKGILSK